MSVPANNGPRSTGKFSLGGGGNIQLALTVSLDSAYMVNFKKRVKLNVFVQHIDFCGCGFCNKKFHAVGTPHEAPSINDLVLARSYNQRHYLAIS